MTCGKGPLPTLGEDRALLMPIRGGNEARFRRKRAADHAPPLPDEVARGIHGSFTGESGRGARFSAIGRSFTGKVALGRCGEHFATALAGAGALSGRAREGFPGGSLRRQRGQGVGGPILAFAERRGCGQDSVPPDGPGGVRHRASLSAPAPPSTETKVPCFVSTL